MRKIDLSSNLGIAVQTLAYPTAIVGGAWGGSWLGASIAEGHRVDIGFENIANLWGAKGPVSEVSLLAAGAILGTALSLSLVGGLFYAIVKRNQRIEERQQLERMRF